MSIWTFDATHSTHGRLQLERVLHYGVDTGGAVNKTDELGVWRGNVQITSFEGRGEGFKNTQGHIYW